MHELEKKLGYAFRDPALLTTALTHSSYANENRAKGAVSNERLEFLGDSILGMTVAYHLYKNFPAYPEGKMTRLRAELVCEQGLHKVASRLELGRYIWLGKGEEHSGGRQRSSILADAVEALLAALYLDGGYQVARDFVNKYILEGIQEVQNHRSVDYKTTLQELIQQHSGAQLSYRMLGESGPDHDKRFTAEVCWNERPIGQGIGRTKKEAEQEAARKALEELKA